MSSNKRAVLVLDVQNDLVDPAGKVGSGGLAGIVAERNVLNNLSKLLHHARSTGIPVAYTRLGYREDFADVTSQAARVAPMRANKVAVRGSWGCEFPEQIAPAPDELVFEKQWVNPLVSTGLVPWLARREIGEVVLAGVATNLVVESTARHADDLGWRVTVVEDCCASPNPAWHEFAVTQILPVFGRVVGVDDLIAEDS